MRLPGRPTLPVGGEVQEGSRTRQSGRAPHLMGATGCFSQCTCTSLTHRLAMRSTEMETAGVLFVEENGEGRM
jgi:hypothetical protein